MTKTKFFLVLFVFLITTFFAKAWQYPLQEVSVPDVDCKFQPWSQHSSDCKTNLPVIENHDYQRYKDDMDYRLIYSVLWWATYRWWWDVGYWWHSGVDIATAQWTPLYSINDWTVEVASHLPWWWNTVVIRHDFEWGHIRSVYAHMHEINVNNWQQVSSWERIGTVGNTWTSRWNHVHFQIDINQDWQNPWYYSNCWWGSATIVNEWRCRDQLLANTVDPIRFLETNWASLKLPDTEEEREQIAKEEQERQEEDSISEDEIQTRETIMLSELELFLARYNFDTTSNIPWNTMDVWDEWSITLTAEHRWRPFNWSLPMSLEAEYDEDIISVSPRTLIAINDWQRDINIQAVSPWSTNLILKIRWKIIANYSIRVVDDDTTIEAENARIYNLQPNRVGWQNRWIFVAQDENRNNIIRTPYEWNITLTTNNNAKICSPEITSRSEVSKTNNFECWPDDLKDEISFSYFDTLEGLYLFKIVPTNNWSITIQAKKDWEEIWQSMPKNSQFPSDISNSQYQSDIRRWLTKQFFDNHSTNNFAPSFIIRERDAKNWIYKTFYPFAEERSWSAMWLSRLEFMELLNDMLGIKSNSENNFRDVSWEQAEYANILLDYWIHLDDYFPRYFQPDKQLTREEAAHILNTLRR